ncbi:oligosaccharide flippase family protein [Rossellomorea aquimaris]|uniref:oligosaccharide flippase family protein n=1 Tax=Rossellomorea aquimaris TaxID=189382 RepID=UPI001CD6B7A9|nr:oligosaccharide flippase family protein [Rossellomorea aquimaris]MCA1056016.1 oligosaccharide flippase family protein [Rossellomorea aquimaris]
MSLFLRGTLVLVITAFFGEMVEFMVNMILARELGEAGLGTYMSILPTVFLVVILSSMELPISLSKFIAEKEESYHKGMLHYVFRFAVLTTIILLVVMILVYMWTPLFSGVHPGIRWLILAVIPIVAFTSITRGYFMGIQQMRKIAVANFMRKGVQLILLVSIYQFLSFSSDTSIFIALCTLVASEAVVFIYLIQAYLLNRRGNKKKRMDHVSMSKQEMRRSILSVSVPTTVLRIFHAFTHAVQPFLIKLALVHSGMGAFEANEHFGMMAGIALTIGFFPSFIAFSLLIVLIPTISEKASSNDTSGILQHLKQVMVITFGYGIPAVMIYYLLGDYITSTFFHSVTSAYYLKLLWPYFFFHFLLLPLQAFLIGLGFVKDALLHTIWASVFSFSLIYILGSDPGFGMEGVIIGMNAGAVLSALLHYFTICRELETTIWLKPLVKM